jgi:2',3'-cyclic-nucleotide 2'-phosphodiesterase (5'-nucleotidase family)
MNFLIKILFFFFLFGLISCSTKTTLKKTQDTHFVINNSKEDSSITNTIIPYKKKHDATMQSIIASSEGSLLKADVESTLGNFFCDAVLYETKKTLRADSVLVDIAIFNKGGLRNSLPKGSITIGNIFELMPFDNEVVLLKFNASQIKEICEKIIEKGGVPIGGMELIKNNTEPIGIKVNGKDINQEKNYWIVTSDYLANGGDNYTFFKSALERKNLNILLRDVIISYCEDITKLNQTIKPTLDGRIQISK